MGPARAWSRAPSAVCRDWVAGASLRAPQREGRVPGTRSLRDGVPVWGWGPTSSDE
jgi:hypothetical protein